MRDCVEWVGQDSRVYSIISIRFRGQRKWKLWFQWNFNSFWFFCHCFDASAGGQNRRECWCQSCIDHNLLKPSTAMPEQSIVTTWHDSTARYDRTSLSEPSRYSTRMPLLCERHWLFLCCCGFVYVSFAVSRKFGFVDFGFFLFSLRQLPIEKH